MISYFVLFEIVPPPMWRAAGGSDYFKMILCARSPSVIR